MTETAEKRAEPTPRPWYWEEVKDINYTREHTLEGPDVLCRYWGNRPPSEDALLIAAALDTAAERDRLKAANAELIGALEMLVEEKVDYMKLNYLGDPEKQHTIKVARAALAKAKEPTP